MSNQPSNPPRFHLGQRVRYLTHHCDAEITGFFMNEIDPTDPEAHLFLTPTNIEQFPEFLLAVITPNPKFYSAIEIRFLRPGSFCHFEVRPDELQPLTEETAS